MTDFLDPSQYAARVADLDARQRTAESAMSAAQAERDRAAFHGKPTAKVDDELRGYAAELANVAGARRHLAEVFAASTARAKADHLRMHIDGTRQFLKDRTTAAKAVQKALDQLHRALGELHTADAGAHAAFVGAAQLAGVDLESAIAVSPLRSAQSALQDALHSLAQPGHFGRVQIAGYEQRERAGIEAQMAADLERVDQITSTWSKQ